MSQPVTIATVCAALLAFGVAHVYINFFRPELWLKFRGDRGNQQYEQRILKDELFVAKCRTAGVFGILFIIVGAYGLFLNIPKLF